jgi:predicted DNA-binding protein
MSDQTKRTTVYLENDLHKALRLKAVETSKTMSDIINEAVRLSLLEDAEDLAAIEDRTDEPLISYEEMVKKAEARWPDIKYFSNIGYKRSSGDTEKGCNKNYARIDSLAGTTPSQVVKS